MNKLPEDRYALVGFNYNSIILSYLTRDPQGVVVYFDYLNGTTEPGVGTNMGGAITAAMRVVDADDRPTGTMGKLEAHRRGALHRAFSVFGFDGLGRLLLQRRADAKSATIQEAPKRAEEGRERA